MVKNDSIKGYARHFTVQYLNIALGKFMTKCYFCQKTLKKEKETFPKSWNLTEYETLYFEI